MIFELKEDHVPAEEEKVVKEEVLIKRLPEAKDMPCGFFEIKETMRIGR